MKTQEEVNKWFELNYIDKESESFIRGFLTAYKLEMPPFEITNEFQNIDMLFVDWFEEKFKDILIPSNINICNFANNTLGIMFNANKQVLTCSNSLNVYIVVSNHNLCIKQINCKLIPCKYGNIKAGEIFFDSEIITLQELEKLSNYVLKVDDNLNFCVNGLEVKKVFYTEEHLFYKVVSIS